MMRARNKDKTEDKEKHEDNNKEEKKKKRDMSKHKYGAWDALCLVIRLFGTFFYAITVTLFIYILIPLRLFNFIWRKLGVVSFFPVDIATQLWARGLFRVIGGKAVVTISKKIPTDQPTVFMYSHGSFYDPVMIGAYAPIAAKYIFKKELMFVFPIIFLAAWFIGHIPINRAKRNSAISSLHGAAYAIVIAPEGTRTTDGTLQPFKKGPFHLAFDAEVKHIVPVVIDGAWDLWPPGQIFPLPGTIILRYLDPISTEGETMDTMSDKLYAAMDKELQEIKRTNPNLNNKPAALRNILPAILTILGTVSLGYFVYTWYLGYSVGKSFLNLL